MNAFAVKRPPPFNPLVPGRQAPARGFKRLSTIKAVTELCGRQPSRWATHLKFNSAASTKIC